MRAAIRLVVPAFVLLVAIVGLAPTATAKDRDMPNLVVTDEDRVAELEVKNNRLRQEIEEQNKRLAELLTKVQAITAPAVAQPAPPPPAPAVQVKQAVDEALQQRDQQQKDDAAARAADAKSRWYAVGSDLKMSASWNDGPYWQTANKDFWVHLGGQAQNDYYWWDQSAGLRVPPGKGPPAGIKAGVASGGIGDLTDGDIWRRLRLQIDGGFWEVFEFRFVPEFANVQFGTVGLDECWVGITKVPLIGSVRVGHMKVADGLEAGVYSATRGYTFLELSSMADAFAQSTGTGLWLTNSFLDDRVTYAAQAYRQDVVLQTHGNDFGDGEYAYDARLTALPWYSDNGNCLVHLGAWCAWRKAQTGFDPATGSPTGIHTVRLRARPEMRDIPSAQVSGTDPSGNVLGGNKNRLVDSGSLVADSSSLVGLEFLAILGPFSLQAEYDWDTVHDVTIGKTTAGDFTFNGGYVQLSYVLTGEHRAYDKRLGRLATDYLGRQGPYTPFWLVRDAGGNLDWGWGAWELAVRYSYLDLNDGVVRGGKEEGWSAAVNWILNNNLRMTFQYQWNDRYSVPRGVVPGSVNGFGVRAQIMF